MSATLRIYSINGSVMKSFLEMAHQTDDFKKINNDRERVFYHAVLIRMCIERWAEEFTNSEDIKKLYLDTINDDNHIRIDVSKKVER